MKKEKEYFEKAKKELIIDTHRFEILTDDHDSTKTFLSTFKVLIKMY